MELSLLLFRSGCESVYQETCLNAFNTLIVIVQGVYKCHDTDGSGVIGADELPAAFRAAGELLSPILLFNVTEQMKAKQSFKNQ